MTTTAKTFCCLASLSSFRPLRRAAMLLMGLWVAVSVTGCGVLSFGRGDDLMAADEALIGLDGKGPRQLSPSSARVLPKPEFGVTPEVQAELNRFMTAERGTVLRVLDTHSDRYIKTKEV